MHFGVSTMDNTFRAWFLLANKRQSPIIQEVRTLYVFPSLRHVFFFFFEENCIVFTPVFIDIGVSLGTCINPICSNFTSYVIGNIRI